MGIRSRSAFDRSLILEKLQRVKPKTPGDSLERSERQVALAPLHSTHVGAMDAEHLREGFLRKAPRLAIGAQVPAEGAVAETSSLR